MEINSMELLSPPNFATQQVSAFIKLGGDVICILMLTKHYVQTLVSIAQAQWSSDSPQAHSSFILSDLLLQLVPQVDNNISFPNLQSFCSHITSLVENKEDSKIFIQLLHEQIEEINSPDDLQDFFQELPSLFEENAAMNSNLDARSFLGIFVRRCLLSFTKLMFHEISRVFDEFNDFASSNLESGTEERKHNPVIAEYEKLEDDLHQFFDIGKRNIPDIKKLIPYMTLNLSILHYSMGHEEEATNAINETIRIAQERSDSECSTYALSWLNYMRGNNSHWNDEDEQLLNTAIARSTDIDLQHLSSLNLLELSKRNLHRNVPLQNNLLKKRDLPLSFWNSLNLSAHMMYSLPSEVSKSSPEYFDLIGSHFNLRSTAWNIFGNKEYANLLSAVELNIHSDSISIENKSLAYCKLAQDFADNCEYKKAIQCLKKAHFECKGSLKAIKMISNVTSVILHERALYRGQFQVASTFTSHLQSLVDESNIKSKMEYLYRLSQLFMYTGDSIKLLDIAKSQGSEMQRVAYSIALADLYEKSGNAASALSYVLASISICQSRHWNSLLGNAITCLANIYLQLGDPIRALHVLQNGFARILHSSSKHTQGVLYLTMAKCMIANAGNKMNGNSMDNSNIEKEMNDIIHFLQKAKEIFTKEENINLSIEVMYLLARIYHFLGLRKERNEAAKQFKELNEKKLNNIQEEVPSSLDLNILVDF